MLQRFWMLCAHLSHLRKSFDVGSGTRLMVWRWLLIGAVCWIGIEAHRLAKLAQETEWDLKRIESTLNHIERNTDPGSGDLARNGARFGAR